MSAPMYFMVIATDKPGALALRGSHARVTVMASGASLAGDSTVMSGSLLIVSAASHADVVAFSHEDPYYRAGLFASVDIRRWDWTFGGPNGPTASVNPI